jgi:hypothetical protein
MKHHFFDFLDRKGDYWTIVPNVHRYAYSIDKEIRDKKKVKIITIGKTNSKWEQVFELPNLEELTLHDPSKEQLKRINKITQLTRLRITHARPANIEFISGLVNLEEIVFEYVSGFSDLSPLRKLKKLRSLHFENVRRVHDFGGLKGLKSLKYLYINGTLDWKQPIDNFKFLEGLPNLEVFAIVWVINDTPYPAFLPILSLKKLKKIKIVRNMFPTKEYAFLETALPHVEGARWDLCWENYDCYEFLGKRAGRVKFDSPVVKEKCDEFTRIYEEMKSGAKALIKKHRR